jgi:hypothetical protein
MSPIRIGILGAARIAPPALIDPARDNGDVEIVAVAARDLVRAQAFADQHGIPEAFGAYEDLISHPGIDAVYNALPPSRHSDLTLAALAAGKHVLCEKPFSMSADEAEAMTGAAARAGLILMEAFHYRYHPLWDRVLEIVGRDLGPIEQIEAEFSVPIAETPDELRYFPELGGGALGDLGTYCVHWCRTIAGSEPEVRSVSRDVHVGGVDLATRAELSFPGGVQATIICDMRGPMAARLKVKGAGGELTVINPLAPQAGHVIRLKVAGEIRTEAVERVTTYERQLAAFVRAVRTGEAPITSGQDTVAQMRVLDAIRAI